MHFIVQTKMISFFQPVFYSLCSIHIIILSNFLIYIESSKLNNFLLSFEKIRSCNYGGIGVVIGHEITHGFDDRGRQFDKNGNMKQWWNNQTIKRFRERAQCIIDQYSSYVLEDINANVNGRMTQGLSIIEILIFRFLILSSSSTGENIADNGGLKQAYRVSFYSQFQKN